MHQAGTKELPDNGLRELVARQRPGHTLDQRFYRDPEIFERDLERIFLRSWLFAGHVSEIPEPGDYLVYDLARESVILVRGADGEVRGLVNVCRHRGSRVCKEARGRAKRLVCPYHAWTYNLDGSLFAARQMPADFDKAAHGLATVQVRLCEGLIFINFDPEPVDFAPAAELLGPRLKPYRLDLAKVAHRESYPVKANWKLLIENYVECYHCAPAHPHFARSHSIKQPAGTYDDLYARMMAGAETLGLGAEFVDRYGLDQDPGALCCFYNRYPLFDGYVTGSEDGKPLAPLMGDIAGFDGGASNIDFGLLNFMLAYNDHAVAYRFKPVTQQESLAEVVWLVDGDAEEGRDYDLERLTWLWRVTTEQDKQIIERNQAGVNSRYYRPGPFSEMEPFARRFVEWYLTVVG